jgi:hypothetical protein
MPETKSATMTVDTLGKIMDQLARQIGTMNPDGRNRKVLIDEISDLSHIRVLVEDRDEQRSSKRLMSLHANWRGSKSVIVSV